MERRVGGYSRGMRQRAKLAQAVVHDPRVLLLDEPLTGTDPTSRAMILEEVRRRAEAGAVVLFSTHVLPEIEAPALVVSGALDLLTPQRQSFEIARRLPNAEHLALMRASHFALLERPDAVLPAIERFLAKRVPA